MDDLLAEKNRRIEAEKKLSAKRFGWIGQLGSVVTTFTAIGALLFTGLALRQTIDQNTISEQGQITSRYTAAIEQLGSESEDIRLGGIYALQRIMHDSPPDEPTIINVLAAFLRNHPAGSSNPTSRPSLPLAKPPTDIAAALAVLGDRNAFRDLPHVVNLRGINLSDLDLSEIGLDLEFVDLTAANLEGASLTVYVDRDKKLDILSVANLSNAILTDANLAGANFENAELSYAQLGAANMNSANLTGANLTLADISDADLSNAILINTSLNQAEAEGAKFVNASLSGADLTGANFDSADLTKTELSSSILKGTNFSYTRMCDDAKPVENLGYKCSVS